MKDASGCGAAVGTHSARASVPKAAPVKAYAVLAFPPAMTAARSVRKTFHGNPPFYSLVQQPTLEHVEWYREEK